MDAPDTAVVETHSGVVFLVGDRAYKLKKAVDLGFLDFTSLEARRVDCLREVELNRRLSPDVYLGVAAVVDDAGVPCEHLVVMRRLPHDRRLSTLAIQGADVSAELVELADLLARFHAGAVRGPAIDLAATAGATEGRWRANLAALLSAGDDVFDPRLVARAETRAARFIAGRRRLFDARIRAGRAVDGHGDLLGGDVFLLADGARVLDCLEFADELRFGDGLADVAFLAMDLEHLGRADLAASFLAAYRVAAVDEWPRSLEHLYVAERATIRSKVGAIRAAQSGDADELRDARGLLDLAVAHLDAGRVRLVLVGGAPGTGKSTLAAELASRIGATLLRSDAVRKELAGCPADEPLPVSAYTPSAKAAVYDELEARARALLGVGESVVVDASWSSDAWRRSARRLADDTVVDLDELCCVAPAAVAAQRLHDRRGDASDADEAVAATWRADPWPEARIVDTVADAAEVADVAVAMLRGER